MSPILYAHTEFFRSLLEALDHLIDLFKKTARHLSCMHERKGGTGDVWCKLLKNMVGPEGAVYRRETNFAVHSSQSPLKGIAGSVWVLLCKCPICFRHCMHSHSCALLNLRQSHKFFLSSSVPWSNPYLAKSNSRVVPVGAHTGPTPSMLPRINPARVPVRPTCFIGGRSSIGPAQ